MSNISPECPAAQNAVYDDALLSANWNPVVKLLEPQLTERRTRSRASALVSDADAKAFLGRIYAAGA